MIARPGIRFIDTLHQSSYHREVPFFFSNAPRKTSFELFLKHVGDFAYVLILNQVTPYRRGGYHHIIVENQGTYNIPSGSSSLIFLLFAFLLVGDLFIVGRLSYVFVGPFPIPR